MCIDYTGVKRRALFLGNLKEEMRTLFSPLIKDCVTCKTQPVSLLHLPQQERGHLSSGLFGELQLQSTGGRGDGEHLLQPWRRERGVEACVPLLFPISTCLARRLHASRTLPFSHMVFDQWQPWWLRTI